MMEQNQTKSTVLNSALFLDIDGTLLDIAGTPEAVEVPSDLPDILTKLSSCFQGAVALISGREISFIDKLFPDLTLPIAGLHGAELRYNSGEVIRPPQSTTFRQAKDYLKKAADDLHGVIFEDKNMAAALHYRNAEELEDLVKKHVAYAGEIAGSSWQVQHGKMVAELRPTNYNKGTALSQILQLADFKTRIPYAFGDDLTDEQMFLTAETFGGYGVLIGNPTRKTNAKRMLSSPQKLRDWLRQTTKTPPSDDIFSPLFKKGSKSEPHSY